MPVLQNRSQRYAQTAWQCVQDIIKESVKEEKRQKYRSRAVSLPNMILQCGLAQTLAFAQAKKEDYTDWLNDLAKVLEFNDGNSLAKKSRTATSTQYTLLTQQSLEAAGWLKRYATALIPLLKKNNVSDDEQTKTS